MTRMIYVYDIIYVYQHRPIAAAAAAAMKNGARSPAVPAAAAATAFAPVHSSSWPAVACLLKGLLQSKATSSVQQYRN